MEKEEAEFLMPRVGQPTVPTVGHRHCPMNPREAEVMIIG